MNEERIYQMKKEKREKEQQTNDYREQQRMKWFADNRTSLHSQNKTTCKKTATENPSKKCVIL